ncbi:MAG: hypothetical protein OQJ89_14940 [Kangiellaceae bacterium]|nr:hypothetical protein [Kangiellaceae bacterium]MCW9000012.1 hypothetical protein [Kangiellaceae bacterium]MCW9018265.1 hypothetical protein [Kangiellaceae bacterium]
MLEQLIKEWRQQAELSHGTRAYVFAVCADQLEEALQINSEIEPTQSHLSNVYTIDGGLFEPRAELALSNTDNDKKL